MADDGSGYAMLFVFHENRGDGIAALPEGLGAVPGRARRSVPRNVWSDVLLHGTNCRQWCRTRCRENISLPADCDGESGCCAADESFGVHAELGSWAGDQDVSDATDGPFLRAGSNVSHRFMFLSP